MLKQIQKLPYVGIFKLNSGEEFIGKVIEETDTFFKIERPLSIVHSPQGLQFAPTMGMADPEKAITVPKPVITGVPTDSTEQQYISLTTGIALPQKGNIII